MEGADDIAGLSLAALSNRLSGGSISCREVAADALRRLDEVEHLGAVAWREDDAVLANAAELDRAFAVSGPTGPLHGVPVSVKDWIDVTPFRCAGGSLEYADRRPSGDATVVARLRSAGALVVAKSAVGPSSALHGAPQNPFDRRRTPGYSSSGEAILVSTAASAFGIGSDSGGSIRFPAHCCGLVGLRPTWGRVPATGHFPRVGPMADGRTVIGPLTRTVEDMRRVMPFIVGPDGRDPTCVPVPWAPATPVLRGLRVAVQRRGFDGTLRDDIQAMLESAAEALRECGCTVVDDGEDVLDVETVGDITRRYWRRAELGADGIEQLTADWDRSRVRAMRLLERVDAVVSPTAPYPAPLLGVTDIADWTYTLSASLWGWPALVVPAGRSIEHLPIGAQIVAGPWREDVCLGLGAVLECP